jgi:hypothetical protein
VIDPLEHLARDDKWFLGAGDGTLYAPPFPQWLDTPGFWDEATLFQYAFAPLFTVTVLDDNGREIAARAVSRRWSPAELTIRYRFGKGINATEVRTVHPGGIFVSEWRFATYEPARLHLVAWTAQDGASVARHTAGFNGALGFTRMLTDRRKVPLAVRAELACVGGAASWSALRSEHSAAQPHWRFTPFVEQWHSGALPCAVRDEGISVDGLFYAAVHRSVDVDYGGASAAFAMRLIPANSALRTDGSSEPASPRQGTFGGVSRRRWGEFFAGVPAFRCSDPYLETYYWYRWYGLRLNSIAAGPGNWSRPSVCEGVGFFHQPISYSAQCHARELRWRDDPEQARGVFRTFFDHQKADGSLHGRIYFNHLDGTDYYHANWGDALLALDAVWPDDAFVREMYPKLGRFADWLVTTRDAEGSGMFDVVDQYETGQEYMPRYQAVDPGADQYGWENRIRLKGIDVTVYAYALFRALERLAPRAGVSAADGARWADLAARTRDAVRGPMWDPATGMFSDVNPATGKRTGVKAAVCFYPYFTDLADASTVEALERTLLDPAQFWTSFPVPSSSLDDPLFNAEAEWKGKRHACPWNGRTWPMTNSHLVEALARVAREHAPHLRAATASLLRRFVRMMFHDGDLRRANCYEHYNPFTGHASVYRGIDDYQHSWVNDLILHYVMGIHPHDGGITVDPFPFGVEHAEVLGVCARGRTFDVTISGERVSVTCGGQTIDGVLGTPIELPDAIAGAGD